jgi:hypothetical protein
MQPDLVVTVSLGVIGLIGGVGISSVGPGGVLPTIGLFALTALTPAVVAGTSIVTHVVTGIVGAAVYYRSGHLADRSTRRLAGILAATAVVGTPLGVLANAHISSRGFGLVLGVVAAFIAALLWYRTSRPKSAAAGARPVVVSAVGLLVSVAAGLVGIGGPMLTVPLLVLLGTPLLTGLAASQVQAIVISTIGSIGYAASGSIDWRLALVIGVPEVAGVVLGWHVARAVPTRKLTATLIVALFALTPYLALHG